MTEMNSQDEINDEITISVKLPMKLSDVLEQFQTVILEKSLERCHGNKTKAADSLGINRTTFISKAKRHGVISKVEDL
jgi:DNA-binding NtrC family response regulator